MWSGSGYTHLFISTDLLVDFSFEFLIHKFENDVDGIDQRAIKMYEKLEKEKKPRCAINAEYIHTHTHSKK